MASRESGGGSNSQGQSYVIHFWTPLIPPTMSADQVEGFGSTVPLDRPGQPAEVAPVYFMLASNEASYIFGTRVAVTGGKPIP